MKIARLGDMTGGWFVGNFVPTLHATEAVEIAVKEYPAGFCEQWHFHKIATEYTVIVSGRVEMNGECYEKGTIIIIEPGEGTDFKALTDTVTTVVKLPGALQDKYLSRG